MESNFDKIILTLLIVFGLLFSQALFAEEEINLTIRVEGFRNNKGHCHLLIFDSPIGFPESDTDAFLSFTLPIESEAAIFNLSIPSGIYAFSILHDENSNNKMDKYWYGKPKEGFGISNNPTVKRRQPKFDEAAVDLSKNNKELTVKMIYMN